MDLASAVSAVRLRQTVVPSTLAFVNRGSERPKLPLGPSTVTRSPLTETLTLAGIGTGLFPIRDITKCFTRRNKQSHHPHSGGEPGNRSSLPEESKEWQHPTHPRREVHQIRRHSDGVLGYSLA